MTERFDDFNTIQPTNIDKNGLPNPAIGNIQVVSWEPNKGRSTQETVISFDNKPKLDIGFIIRLIKSFPVHHCSDASFESYALELNKVRIIYSPLASQKMYLYIDGNSVSSSEIKHPQWAELEAFVSNIIRRYQDSRKHPLQDLLNSLFEPRFA